MGDSSASQSCDAWDTSAYQTHAYKIKETRRENRCKTASELTDKPAAQSGSSTGAAMFRLGSLDKHATQPAPAGKCSSWWSGNFQDICLQERVEIYSVSLTMQSCVCALRDVLLEVNHVNLILLWLLRLLTVVITNMAISHLLLVYYCWGCRYLLANASSSSSSSSYHYYYEFMHAHISGPTLHGRCCCLMRFGDAHLPPYFM